MNEYEITKQLIDFTVKNSNFESLRNYVSLSHCSLPSEELIAQFNTGFVASDNLCNTSIDLFHQQQSHYSTALLVHWLVMNNETEKCNFLKAQSYYSG